VTGVAKARPETVNKTQGRHSSFLESYKVFIAFVYFSPRGWLTFCNVASLISLSARLINID
jgi:hypothetical protein